MTFFEMHHFAQKGRDGNIHVQNMVAGMFGQHHVHTKRGFGRWRKEVGATVKWEGPGPCNCGLKPGQVREYDGHVWSNPQFKEGA